MNDPSGQALKLQSAPAHPVLHRQVAKSGDVTSATQSPLSEHSPSVAEGHTPFLRKLIEYTMGIVLAGLYSAACHLEPLICAAHSWMEYSLDRSSIVTLNV